MPIKILYSPVGIGKSCSMRRSAYSDYSVGYIPIACYLENRCRIDGLIESVNDELSYFISVYDRYAEIIHSANNGIYGIAEDMFVRDVFHEEPNAWRNSGIRRIKDAFTDDKQFAGFAAFSLVQPLFASRDVYREQLLDRIAKEVPKFKDSLVELSAVRACVTRPSALFQVPEYRESKIWASAATLC